MGVTKLADVSSYTGLSICGIDHLPYAQWVTPHKIVVTLARVKLADRPEAETGANGRRYLQGPVLVTTASGGVCHQSLQFTIEEEEQEDSEGMLIGHLEKRDIPKAISVNNTGRVHGYIYAPCLTST